MNTNAIYTNTCAALESYLKAAFNDEQAAQELYNKIVAAPANYNDLAEWPLNSFAAVLCECIKEDNKKAGRGNALTAAKHLLKIGAKYGGMHNPERGGTWTTDDGKQAACNGFSGFLLDQPLQGLPANEGNKPALDKWAEQINNAAQNQIDITAYLPNRKALADYIKRQKAAYPVLYKNGVCIFVRDAFINAQYLLDMIDILQPEKVAASAADIRRPLYFEGKTGRGVVCCAIFKTKTQAEFIERWPGCNMPAHPEKVFKSEV